MGLDENSPAPLMDDAGALSNVLFAPLGFRPEFQNGVVELWIWGHSATDLAKQFCTSTAIIRAILRRKCSEGDLKRRGL